MPADRPPQRWPLWRIWLAAAVEAQRGTLLLWAPVGLAAGIGTYFALPVEPAPEVLAALALGAALLLPGLWPGRRGRALWAALFLGLSGYVLAGASARRVAAPVLEFRLYGPVTGRIVAVDSARSGRVRITLDRVWIARLAPGRTPARVRVTLFDPDGAPLEPGRMVMLTANLAPPSGAVEPGGFSFRRQAWFRRIGAIGYARAPVVEMAAPDRSGLAMRLAWWRHRLSRAIRARLPGEGGAFAAAFLTGDRAGLDPVLVNDLRRTNLAHLLAISGLHMGLVSGLVVALVRLVLAALPGPALRWPVKEIAALCGIAAAAAYLALAGAGVATQRAFVMVAVVLAGVVMRRRALTLRAVAVAALVVLVLRPVSLVEPGFQMSFAATAALVGVFRALQGRGPWAAGRRGPARRVGLWLLALVVSSAVAGAATAPYAAWHFNRFARYGLLANLAAVPVMGLVVMPAALVALALMPLGLDAPAWAVVDAGIGWILGVAHLVADWPSAVVPVTKPALAALVLVTVGGLMVLLLRGAAPKALGLLPLLAGAVLWAAAERPALLVAVDGRLVGALGPEGRWLNREKGSGFAAMIWLENDGDLASQAEAARRPRPALPFVIDRSKAGPVGGCGGARLVILPRRDRAPPGCLAITRRDLRLRGAAAVDFAEGSPRIRFATDLTGPRLWQPATRRRDARAQAAGAVAPSNSASGRGQPMRRLKASSALR